MRDIILPVAVLTLAAGSFGCAMKRPAEQYRDDTAALLATRSGAIKQCYDDALKADPKLAGTVTLKFTVAKETGQIVNAQVDAASTKAPEKLSSCVMKSVEGLTLAPPDGNDGDATFQWELRPKG
jgi:hypothetical protein